MLRGVDAMERALGLAVSGASLEGHVREAMTGLYREALENPEWHPWCTSWQIIVKDVNQAIGSACFMGCPDTHGMVEIGYGINRTHRNKGYMTEALTALCHWALSQTGVSSIIAGTEFSNCASHTVLQHVGMHSYRESGGTLWWILPRPENDTPCVPV